MGERERERDIVRGVTCQTQIHIHADRERESEREKKFFRKAS